ncbi:MULTISPECIES: YlbL family protein [unclassified Rhodococcus (in: high G+C Gram-positive bacteria)]|nr:PDZ domain-containing protein [Rhodococcus sp. (in: high G+C Gram-positive bacteria)]MBF0661272.1 PDZ domain-containing protein [Rhodococcus sp. (in: high G+C Gram-positive bacteria)]NMD94382.1 PDZ domain-containing protein [Rhodococcus sp. BL-253-APC-6A1W]NME78464.1 PDZ domain-containing protein [Rhodococcus sp. 105337]
MNRRFVMPLAVLLPVLTLVLIAFNLTVPYVALGPGPTFDTLGDVDDKPVIEIEGVETDETTGSLVMTTVGVTDNLNLAQTVTAWLSGRYGLAPREQVYPPNRSKDEVRAVDQAQFAQSERSAELAALHYLDLPVILRVAEIADDAPASGHLQVDDRIVAIAGEPVETAGQVQRAVGAVTPGESVAITVLRGDAEETIDVVVGERPGGEGAGFLGIATEEIPDVPFEVVFNLADIGGPSAGLMFSLALVDKLSPGEINGGLNVAGTGTIDSDGIVGPIGGITHKLTAADEEGAEVFLVPADNCAEALTNEPDDVRLVRVETLEGAAAALESIAAGGDAPTC